MGVWRELHQKVSIAAGGVEVIGTGRRAKHIQPADAVTLADGGVNGEVLQELHALDQHARHDCANSRLSAMRSEARLPSITPHTMRLSTLAYP